MNQLLEIRKDIEKEGDKEKAKVLQRFFKTGKGEYGEGDIFLGLTVPKSRQIAKKYGSLGLKEIEQLLHSKIHEERLITLFVLVEQFEREKDKRKEIFDFYLENTPYINNWDLVDLSAAKIVGAYLFDKPKDILFELAKSKNIWERRISVVSTYYFIKKGKLDETLKIARILITDPHDLIHKAVGWMLREVGKSSPESLKEFLNENSKTMPRTMLRYAIERFSESLRKEYLKKY